MCGIVGIINFDKSHLCLKNKIEDMCNVIKHRGPDDKGVLIDNEAGFGHRRLSIIDIGGGHQPMTTEDGLLSIVFNGEIYNYKEIRQLLEKEGSKFLTNSDTEVILESYRRYGVDCASKLNGIFAFAIWDRSSRSVYLARDHMGIKPLYYHMNNDALIFSSEIKSLFESGYLKPECNKDAIPEYFTFRHVSGERSLFKNVLSLLPGHYMIYKAGKIDIQQYWSPLNVKHKIDCSFNETMEKLENHLIDAVKMQMMSDVPLGTFCSGGVDSSLVTAIAAQHSNKAINTFSVGFNEAEYDETKYARMVAERYGTSHHELVLDNQEFADYLPEMVYFNDEPLNFANSVQIYAVSKLAKQHVTVVLTGEGADELLGGYPRYKIPTMVARLQALPTPVKWSVGEILSLINDHRAKKLHAYLNTPLNDVVLYNTASLSQEWKKILFPNIKSSDFKYRQDILHQIALNSSWLEKVSREDQSNYLVSILNRQDKLSMGASLESRVPFLDYRLVEFSNTINDSFKQKGTKTKHILKTLAEKYLPHEVIYRRKSGFGVPLADWFRKKEGLGQLAEDVFGQIDYSDVSTQLDIRKVLQEHRSMHHDHSEILWTALNYGLWKQKFNIA